jgi:hypothetical protein
MHELPLETHRQNLLISAHTLHYPTDRPIGARFSTHDYSILEWRKAEAFLTNIH